MALHHLENLENYLQASAGHPEEIEALYQEILIRVTSFFRDEDVFAALTQDVFPALVQNRNPDVPIRTLGGRVRHRRRDLFHCH